MLTLTQIWVHSHSNC